MSAIRLCNNPIHVYYAKGRTAISFTPKGKLKLPESRTNPYIKGGRFKETWLARIIVGLSVKGKTVEYDGETVWNECKAYLVAHKQKPDSSYVSQKGTYTHDKDGEVVTENSMQIIIINLSGMAEVPFRMLILHLCEYLARRFEQESIISEIQRNGVVQETAMIAAKKLPVRKNRCGR